MNKKQIKKEKIISFDESKLNEMINVVYRKGISNTIDNMESIIFQSIHDGYEGMKNTVILEYLKNMREKLENEHKI